MEHDPEVLDYYAQPQSITLRYLAKRGWMTCCTRTREFLVLKPEGVSQIECKTEEGLRELAESMPTCYERATPTGSRCSPGERVGSEYNLAYRVRSAAKLDHCLVRNLRFLED